MNELAVVGIAERAYIFTTVLRIGVMRTGVGHAGDGRDRRDGRDGILIPYLLDPASLRTLDG
jgi:hypothetical protein